MQAHILEAYVRTSTALEQTHSYISILLHSCIYCITCSAYTLLHTLHEVSVEVSRLCHWGAAGSHCLISMQGRHIYYIWCVHTASPHALLRMYTAIAMHWAAAGGHWLACRIAEQAHMYTIRLCTSTASPEHTLKGIVHNFFLYCSNLIFWIVMECGIADFGRRGL